MRKHDMTTIFINLGSKTWTSSHKFRFANLELNNSIDWAQFHAYIQLLNRVKWQLGFLIGSVVFLV